MGKAETKEKLKLKEELKQKSMTRKSDLDYKIIRKLTKTGEQLWNEQVRQQNKLAKEIKKLSKMRQI